MQTIQVKNGQSLYDVAVQHCGKVDAVSEIVTLNNLSFTPDLVEGQSLVLPDIQDLKVVKEFLIEGITPANDVSITPWDVVLITDTYEVLRTFEVNFSNPFCAGLIALNKFDAVDDNITLKDSTGASTSVGLKYYEYTFDDARCDTMPAGAYIRESSMMESGLMARSPQNSKLKLTGLSPTKFYQFYIVSGTANADAGIKITIGDTSITRITTGNYPYAANGDMYINPAVLRFYNRLSNSSGEIIIEFEKQLTGWPVALNYLIIEETNEQKV